MTIVQAIRLIESKVGTDARLALNDRMICLLEEAIKDSPQKWDHKPSQEKDKPGRWRRTIDQGKYSYTTSWYTHPDVATLESAIHYTHNHLSTLQKLYFLTEEEAAHLFEEWTLDN